MMGIFYETILVRNILKGGEPIELTVKVDTGATMLVLPGWLQEQLQFPVIRRQIGSLCERGNGRTRGRLRS